MYEVLDDTAAQVLLALEPGDSIRRVAHHLQTPYETVRQAVIRLEDAGYVQYDDGLDATDDRVRDAARQLVAASARVSPPTIEEAYVLPQFAGLPFAYTGIDAIYIWTRGGYQVARDEFDYPLFIAVRETDVSAWRRFFDPFGIPVGTERRPSEAVDEPLQVVLEPRESLEATDVDGRPVVPLTETIGFARANEATFEPALAMLDRMYETADIETEHRTELTAP